MNKEDRPSCKDLLNSNFFEEDIGIRLEPTSTDTFLKNFDINVIEFRLRLLDPKKRSCKHKENEAIQFEFDISKDDFNDICQEMCNSNIINETDSRAVTKLLKVQVNALIKERKLRHSQIQIQNLQAQQLLQQHQQMYQQNVSNQSVQYYIQPLQQMLQLPGQPIMQPLIHQQPQSIQQQVQGQSQPQMMQQLLTQSKQQQSNSQIMQQNTQSPITMQMHQTQNSQQIIQTPPQIVHQVQQNQSQLIQPPTQTQVIQQVQVLNQSQVSSLKQILFLIFHF